MLNIQDESPMTAKAKSVLIIVLLWAAIYLPALGSLEIKGEEGRRILPAVSMLETRNYVVPRVGSESYFSKPPLINWLVAASFKLFGQSNEWTARLPSALCVLSVALAFVTVGRASLGARGSTIAAIIWLTNIGMIEKGRLIEIEALYVSLAGLATILWLSFWEQKKSAWLTWTVPWIFLGLGWLAKGPVHLAFFYAVVLAVLWQSGSWRSLFHPAHFLGLTLMFGIFAVWAVPFAQATGNALALNKWSNQFSGRLKVDDFKLSSWILNIPRGVLYFLPWTLLLPLVRFSVLTKEQDRQIARSLAWGTVVPFVVINLVPGAMPRYSMPALMPASWLLAMILSAENLAWPRWLSGKPLPVKDRQWLVGALALVACVSIFVYAVAIVPILQKRPRLKAIAAKIDAMVPRNETLYAINPNFQPIFFYLRSKLIYSSEISDVSPDAQYVLVQPEWEHEVGASDRWAPRHPHPIFRTTDSRHRSIILLKID